MRNKVVSVIMLTLLFVGMLTLAFNIQQVEPTGNSRYFATYAGQSTLVGGFITENTTWTLAGSPYIVVEDVIVVPDVFLTIEPGVVAKFTSGTSLVVDGSLIAQGNSTYKITFTSNATIPAVADWESIYTRGSARFDYSVIEYALTGVRGRPASRISVNHSIIQNCSYGTEGSCIVTNSKLLSNNMGIYTVGQGSVSVNHTEILKTKQWAIYSRYEDILSVSNSLISESGRAIVASATENIYISKCNISYNGGNPSVIEYYGGNIQISDSIISNNGGGATLDGDDCLIEDTTISNNTGSGISIRWGTLTVSNSNLTHNWCGIYTLGGHEAINVFNSIISHNRYNGLIIVDGDVKVVNSVISHNQGVGLDLVGAPTRARGHFFDVSYTNITDNGIGVLIRGIGKMHFVNIFNNTEYNVENMEILDINATHNWWGTTNETVIEESIYDYYDDYNLGRVVYKPYLTEPVVIGIPRVRIYPDKYYYSKGDMLYLGIDVKNPGSAVTVCVEVWVEKPVGPPVVFMHKHAITLKAWLDYSNPSQLTFGPLPSIPPGVYTWHAAILDPTTHDIIDEDTAPCEFV